MAIQITLKTAAAAQNPAASPAAISSFIFADATTVSLVVRIPVEVFTEPVPRADLRTIEGSVPDGVAVTMSVGFFSTYTASEVLGAAEAPLAVLPVEATARTVRTFERLRTAPDEVADPLRVTTPAGAAVPLAVSA